MKASPLTRDKLWEDRYTGVYDKADVAAAVACLRRKLCRCHKDVPILKELIKKCEYCKQIDTAFPDVVEVKE